MDLTDIYRIFHPNTKAYTFFSVPNGIIPKFDHIVSYKTSLNKNQKIEVTSCIQSEHHGLKLDISNNGNKKRSTEQLFIHGSLAHGKN